MPAPDLVSVELVTLVTSLPMTLSPDSEVRKGEQVGESPRAVIALPAPQAEG